METGGTVQAVAEEALRLVFVDPRRATGTGRLARDRAVRERDAAARSTAERALGLAAKELGDLRAAAAHLRRAVAVADVARLPVPAAEARMSLALVLATRGDTGAALRCAERAGSVLDGLAAARLRMQLALIMQRLGRFDEAVAGFRQALATFRQEGDLLWQAKLLNNR